MKAVGSTAHRILAFLLVGAFSLHLPAPTFALRELNTVENPKLTTGLEETLKSPDTNRTQLTQSASSPDTPVTFVSPTALVPTVPQYTAGLEEHPPKKLSWGAWWATFGYWGPTDRALEKFGDLGERESLRKKAELLIEWMYRKGIHAYLPLLQERLPVSISRLDKTQLDAVLDLAIRLVEKGVKPDDTLEAALPTALLDESQFQDALALANKMWDTGVNPSSVKSLLREGFPLAASALTRERWQAAMDLAGRIVDQGRDPVHFIQALPSISRASPDPELFHRNIQALEKLAIAPFPFVYGNNALSVYTLSPAAEQLTPEQFNLAFEKAAHWAMEWATEAPSAPYLLMRYGVHVLAEVSQDQAEFQTNLETLGEILRRAKYKTTSLAEVLSWGGLSAVGKVSRNPEEFRGALGALESFVTSRTSGEEGAFLGRYFPPVAWEGSFSAVSQVSSNLAEFQANLNALAQLFSHNALRGQAWWQEQSKRLLFTVKEILPVVVRNSSDGQVFRSYLRSLRKIT